MDIMAAETFPLKLVSKVDGKELGITFNVEPFSLAADVDAWTQSAMMFKQIKAAEAGAQVGADDIAEVDKEATIRKAIFAVRSWDWGGHTMGDLWPEGENPPCTDEMKRAVFTYPRAGWIVEQVKDAGMRVSNFTKVKKPKS